MIGLVLNIIFYVIIILIIILNIFYFIRNRKIILKLKNQNILLVKEINTKNADIESFKQEKDLLEVEKSKVEDKNKKIWQMSESVYKEKKRVDELNDNLIHEKQLLEEEKQKFQEKNKKLWNQSLAIHKEKERIDRLKQIVERNYQSITDSINYAKRIQQAILPQMHTLSNVLSESFIFYQPKDIVSGDFYWFDKVNEKIYVAAVDCTGHGVPGAFMSIIGYINLHQAVNEYHIYKPSEILNFLSKNIHETLQKNNITNVKDGMDLALCSIDMQNMVMEYSGAYNPLYIVRNNEVLIYNTDKQPIGGFFIKGFESYTNHEIPIVKNDNIYLFSDGYIDQFGGQDKKKFMSKRFREKLLEIKNLSMQEQKNALHDTFMDWRGGGEQIDDVLVIGFKII